MKTMRYDLHLKVKGNNGTYVIRRRSIDGGLECTCPRGNHQKLECRHVKEHHAVIDRLPRVNVLRESIEKVFDEYWLQPERYSNLIDRLVKAVQEIG